MSNRYALTDVVREKWTPIIQRFIKAVEQNTGAVNKSGLVLDFSDTDLNPATLGEILESLGYGQVGTDCNGWQMDFWMTYAKESSKPLTIRGTGITFSGKLTVSDNHYGG